MKSALLILITLSSYSSAGSSPKEKTQTPLIYGKLAEKVYRPDIYLPRMVEKEILKNKFDKYRRLSDEKKISTDTSEVFDFKSFLENGSEFSRKSCSDVCPKDFRILSMNSDQIKRDESNHLSILNLDDDFASWRKKTVGYCWGYTATLSDFQHLMFFDPDNKLNRPIPIDNDSRIEQYKKLIHQVSVKNKTAIFTGVSSIRELTSIPEIKEYLLKVVGQRWALNATHVQSVANMLIDDVAMTSEEYFDVVNELKSLLSVGVQPRIIFADDSPGFMGMWSHVVNVERVESFADGSHKIFINETNYYPENDPQEKYFILVTAEGTAHYEPLLRSSRMGDSPHDRVGKIKLSHEFERDTAKYVDSMHKMCVKLTHCE